MVPPAESLLLSRLLTFVCCGACWANLAQQREALVTSPRRQRADFLGLCAARQMSELTELSQVERCPSYGKGQAAMILDILPITNESKESFKNHCMLQIPFLCYKLVRF